MIIALNTDTVLERELAMDDLRRIAGELGEAVTSGKEGGVEIALCLTMPQTADVALVRLAVEAPFEAGSGEFDTIVLLSRDRELRRSLGALVIEGCAGVQVSRNNNLGMMWQCPEGNQLRRRPPRVADARAPGAGPSASVDFYTIQIDSRALAGWAMCRSIDVKYGSSLFRLAQEIDQHPWLLSQLGLTEQSARGVARIGALPGITAMGACSHKDGIELRGGGECEGVTRHIRKASVGIGAVRLEEGVWGTVSTKLPFGFLSEIGGEYAAGRSGELNDTEVLRRAPMWKPMGAEVTVEFERSMLAASAEVRRPGPKQQPQAWWLRYRLCKTMLRFEELMSVLPRRIESAARVMAVPHGIRFPDGSAATLALRWPEVGPVDVTVQSESQIGACVLGQGHVGERAAAVLATKRLLNAGEKIRCLPSQEVPLAQMVSAMPGVGRKALEWLCFLPVLIAL